MGVILHLREKVTFFLPVVHLCHAVKCLLKRKNSHWHMITGLKGFWLQVNTQYHKICDEIMGINNDCHMADTPGPFADTLSC